MATPQQSGKPIKRSIFFALVLVVIFVAADVYFLQWKKQEPEELPGFSIQELSAAAFGSIANSSGTKSAAQTSERDAVAPVATDTATIAPDIYPASYTRYTYVGDPLTLPGKSVTVYKRTPATSTDTGLLVNAASFGLADLASFADAVPSYATFVQKKPFGYMVSVDYENASMSISQYWQGWYGTDTLLREAGTPVESADAIRDADVIATANAFLDEHGINRSVYGAPLVQQDAGVLPLGATVVEDSTISSDVRYGGSWRTVLYPLRVNGVPVVDQSGNATGLQVQFDSESQRISGVSNIMLLTFSSSSYRAVQSAQDILDAVDLLGYVPEELPEDATVAEIQLGTPKQQLMEMYQYDDATGISSVLLVPAFVFPVTSAPEDGGWYQTSVVIPLAEDVFPQYTNDIKPLPAVDVSDGSSGEGSAPAGGTAEIVPE